MFIITNDTGAIISVYSTLDSAEKVVQMQFTHCRYPYAEKDEKIVGYCGIASEHRYRDTKGCIRYRVTELNGHVND